MSVELARELFYRPADERTILSFCLKSLDFYYDVSSKLEATDFLVEEHQLIYVMIGNLVNKGIPKIDMTLFINQSQSDGVIDLVGGISYIQSIFNIEASKENFNIYVDQVIEASTKYKLYVSLCGHTKTVTANSQSGKTSAEMINQVETNMLDMSTRASINDEPILFGETLDEYIAERKDEHVAMTGLSTGFPILDRQIDGMIPGTLMIIGARKKMGKSTFLTNIAIYNAYKQNIPVLYIDTEMTYTEWKTRALSIISGVKERDIKHGGYSREDFGKIMRARNTIANDGKIFHKYMPNYSVDKVVSLCKKYKIKENIGLIVFDYLKEPDLASTDGTRKEYQLLGDITTKLKDLAGILNIPALTAVQLNKQNDVADSDRIARFGDIVAMWAYRTEEEKKMCGIEGGQYKLVIKDTRRGGSTPPEGIGYTFFKSRLYIREVPPADQFFMTPGIEATNADELDDMFNDDLNPYIEGTHADELS